MGVVTFSTFPVARQRTPGERASDHMIVARDIDEPPRMARGRAPAPGSAPVASGEAERLVQDEVVAGRRDAEEADLVTGRQGHAVEVLEQPVS